MTRSQKYDVNSGTIDTKMTELNQTSFTSTSKAKDYDYSFSTNSSSKPVLTVVNPLKPKKRFIPWVAMVLIGVCAACFLGFIYGTPTSPVHLRSPKASYTRNTTVQGSLVLYPHIPGFNSHDRFPHEYFIGMDDKYLEPNFDSLVNVTSGYPHHASDQPPPKPYVHCWLDTPSPSEPCFFDKGWLGRNCVGNNKFGYHKESDGQLNPCFLLRLENSGSWFPRNLKPEMVNLTINPQYDPSFIGLECKPRIKKHSHVKILQNPVKGFPLSFFPIDHFQNSEYLLPAVMVRVYGIQEGENVTIECRFRATDSFHLKDFGKILVTFFHLPKVDELDPRVSMQHGSEDNSTDQPSTDQTDSTSSYNNDNTPEYTYYDRTIHTKLVEVNEPTLIQLVRRVSDQTEAPSTAARTTEAPTTQAPTTTTEEDELFLS